MRRAGPSDVSKMAGAPAMTGFKRGNNMAANSGTFGDRFAGIAKGYGAEVRRLDAPWGRPISPARLYRALVEWRDARAVLLVHVESSTGVRNDIKRLAAAARAARPDILVL